MADWSITFPPEIIFYIIIPIGLSVIPAIFAWVKRREVTAVKNYVLEEIKEDVKDLKERVRTLELLSPGSLVDERKHRSS